MSGADTPACFVVVNSIDTMPQRTDSIKKPTPAPEFIKTSAVARRLGVNANTILKWSASGQLPVRTLRVAKSILFNRSDVDALVAGSAQ